MLVTEMLVHEFYLVDISEENWQHSQIINMMNVNYTSKMNLFLGAYGPAQKGFAFKPVIDHRVSKAKDPTKTSGDVMYRGMIMKYHQE